MVRQITADNGVVKILLFCVVLLFLSNGPVQADISSNLLGHWTFDDGSGTVAFDSSANNNDGNLINGPAWVTGKIGGAIDFDGVDDYVKPFEDQVGFFLEASKNWTKGFGNRIIDFIKKDGTAWEAKSGKYLYLSSQIKDFLKDPKFTEKFNLVIRQGAKLSGPLMFALKKNGAELWLLTKEGLVNITSSLDSMVPLIIFIDPETGLPIGMPLSGYGYCQGGSMS